MSVVGSRPTVERVIVRNVRWETYESLLKDLENSSSPRLAFDRGVLEIMSPHIEHEDINRTLASIVETVLEESDCDFRNAGSTTFKREMLERGFEPDTCFYIQHVAKVRNKKRIDMEVDPPPDLLIEVDLPKDSMDKFPLYQALRVPEVWRYRNGLEIWILEGRRYIRREVSAAVPCLSASFVSQLLESAAGMTRPQWLRQARQRIRALIVR